MSCLYILPHAYVGCRVIVLISSVPQWIYFHMKIVITPWDLVNCAPLQYSQQPYVHGQVFHTGLS